MERKIPTVLAAAFLLITFTRVANFIVGPMRSGWVGMLFSAVIEVTIFALAFVSEKWPNTRKKALTLLAFFILASGLFNLMDVLLAVKPSWQADWLLYVVSLVYGLLPTVAVTALGLIQGDVDKNPKPQTNVRRDILGAVKRAAVRWVDGLVPAQPSFEQLAESKSKKQVAKAEAEANANANANAESLLACPKCGREFKSQKALNGHMKGHREVK